MTAEEECLFNYLWTALGDVQVLDSGAVLGDPHTTSVLKWLQRDARDGTDNQLIVRPNQSTKPEPVQNCGRFKSVFLVIFFVDCLGHKNKLKCKHWIAWLLNPQYDQSQWPIYHQMFWVMMTKNNENLSFWKCSYI